MSHVAPLVQATMANDPDLELRDLTVEVSGGQALPQ
jgi:hypothetical protein